MQDLITDFVSRSAEQRRDELKLLEPDQLDRLEQTETHKSGCSAEMGIEMQTELLIQLKNRLVELEREVSVTFARIVCSFLPSVS